MLILGTDSREGTGTEYGTNADACHCSDTIMLARVNPQTKQVSLLSLPRDIPITSDTRSTGPSSTPPSPRVRTTRWPSSRRR